MGWTGDKELPYATLIHFMSGCPSGTVFAVYVSGPLISDSTENKSHWLNAMVNDSKVAFFDFQANRVYVGKPISGKMPTFTGGSNPATCSSPFVAIITQSDPSTTAADMHSEDPLRQTGMLDVAKTSGIAIAFLPLRG
jgi:hypothetical protein